MRFTGNGITNCYPDQVEDFISITVLSFNSTTTYEIYRHDLTGLHRSFRKPYRGFAGGSVYDERQQPLRRSVRVVLRAPKRLMLQQ